MGALASVVSCMLLYGFMRFRNILYVWINHWTIACATCKMSRELFGRDVRAPALLYPL